MYSYKRKIIEHENDNKKKAVIKDDGIENKDELLTYSLGMQIFCNCILFFPSYILLIRGNIRSATITINAPPVAYVAQGLAVRDSTVIV
jgi:hypothetical protein